MMKHGQKTKRKNKAIDSADSPIVRSALWAAWGDALGFPCELVDERMLKKRIPGGFDGQLHPWVRRVGGRMGAMVELPIGSISDDTQLRLATSRCIRRSGHFDAEAFSKIELSVFLSYQLGAGRGTKTAAKTLSRRDSRWYSNFFNVGDQKYINCGGNGAAMRIQPHVWAASTGKVDLFMSSLLRDTVCTHGHPVGILGAAFHGVALWTTLKEGKIPDPSRWPAMVSYLEIVNSVFSSDEMLSSRWIPVWEQQSSNSFKESLSREISSFHKLIKTAIKYTKRSDVLSDDAYFSLAGEIGGLDPSTRGAGTICSLLALWLAWVHKDKPILAVEKSANCLGSDTDTIATMVGALVGPVAKSSPPQLPSDSEMIAIEAKRLECLSHGETLDSFPHPDTLHWLPPKSLSDALGTLEGEAIVAGLGAVSVRGEIYKGNGKNAGQWQWVDTEYGQSLLIKRREKLPKLLNSTGPQYRPGLLQEKNTSSIPNKTTKATALPDDPVQGIKLLLMGGIDPLTLHQLVVHYAQLGSTQASQFAILFSEHIRSLSESSGVYKSLSITNKQSLCTTPGIKQGELTLQENGEE